MKHLYRTFARWDGYCGITLDRYAPRNEDEVVVMWSEPRHDVFFAKRVAENVEIKPNMYFPVWVLYDDETGEVS